MPETDLPWATAVQILPVQTLTPTPPSLPNPLPTPLPNPPPTPAWIVQGPGSVTVPVLMYHHIAVSQLNSRYYVSPQDFDEQLTLLADWGYTTITIDMLVQALNSGRELPRRPIIITFDDGNVDIYTEAFPLMKAHGFMGVSYVVGNYIDAEHYLTEAQIREMLASGWELGSHTMNHTDLVAAQPDQRWYEIHSARLYLEERFDTPVSTLAYPGGKYDSGVMNAVYEAGYTAGMGLGNTSVQYELYALHRIAVQGGLRLEDFADLLPWRERFVSIQ